MKTINLILFSLFITSGAGGQQLTAGLNDLERKKANLTVWYADKDRDSFGDASVMIYANEKRIGFVLNKDDFDDNNPSVFPNAYDICDGIDNDQDGQVDEDPFTVELFPSADLIISENTLIPIYCTAVGEGYTYTWYLNDFVIENENDSYITVGGAGKYVAHVTTPGGCYSVSDPVHVFVLDNLKTKKSNTTASNIAPQNN